MRRQYRQIILTALFIQPIAANAFGAQNHGMMIHDMTVIARNNVSAISPVSQELPIGQRAGGQVSLLPDNSPPPGTGDDLFGLQGGYFHPYLSVAEEYSDNLFNVNQDKKENWLTSISPGLWIALPRTKEVPITIIPHNTSPGGLQMALPDVEGFERYHFYVLGGLDIKFYSEDSDLNDTDAKCESLFQFNLRSGLTLQVVDRYTYGQDRFDAGSSTANGVRRYNSNIVVGTVDWDFSEKFRTQVDYTNFLLDYTDSLDDFLDRSDNSVSAYAYYKYSPKTSFFLEYRLIDVSYAHDTWEIRDNTNNFVYAGIHWASSEKVSLRLKAGYQKKNYDDDQMDNLNSNSDGLALEGDVTYRFTEKTKIDFSVSNKIDETDSSVALNKKLFSTALTYNQRISDRWQAVCQLAYENADYDQIIDQERDDKRFVVSPAIQYLFRDWLMGELKYTYDTRNSSDDYFDYDTNLVMLSLNFAL